MSEIFSVFIGDFLIILNIQDFKLEPIIKLSFMCGTTQKIGPDRPFWSLLDLNKPTDTQTSQRYIWTHFLGLT